MDVLSETTPVSIGLIMALIAILLPVATAFFGLWLRIENRFNRQRDERDVAFAREREERRELDNKLDALSQRLDREFVSERSLDKRDAQLMAAIEKLDGKLDSVGQRLDAFAGRSWGAPK